MQEILRLKNPEYLQWEKYRKRFGGKPFVKENGKWRRIEKEIVFVKNDEDPIDTPRINVKFQGDLYPFQEFALHKICLHRRGVFQIPTGGGKTVLALAIIASKAVPTLIIVHTKELLQQWIDRIETFLNIPREEVGIIGEGVCFVGDRITVGIVNSLVNNLTPEFQKFGMVIVDECHRTPAETFTKVVNFFRARYKYGLTATPYRRDGLSEVIHFYLGKTIFKLSIHDAQKMGFIMTPLLKTFITEFKHPFPYICLKCKKKTMAHYEECPNCGGKIEQVIDYTKLLSALVKDPLRNDIITAQLKSIMEKKDKDAIILCVSDRAAHVKALQELINYEKSVLLTGKIADGKRKKIVSDLRAGEKDLIFATTQLIGEGFDLPNISGIVLTTPIRGKSGDKRSPRLAQVVGRALRPADGKGQPVIYDFVDIKVPILLGSFKSRKKVYRELGIEC